MVDARPPIRGAPWKEFSEEHRSWTRERFATVFGHSFLLIEAVDSGTAERMFKTGALSRPEAGVVAALASARAVDAARATGDLRVFEIVRNPGPRPFPHVTVGRTPTNDIVLANPAVSKCHAIIRLDADGVHRLVDAGSTNGTWLNGRCLQPHEPQPLVDGCHVRFANVYAADFYSPGGLHRLLTAVVAVHET